jgi:hypothetical protein
MGEVQERRPQVMTHQGGTMIQEAKKNGNRRRGQMTREITYQKVLLAVYVLSDGLLCSSINREIAESCGHSIEAVRRSLAEMERRGVVMAFDTRHGLSGRVIILMDHPDALPLARRMSTDYKFRCQFGRG